MLSTISHDFELPIFGTNLRIVLGVPFTWELLYYSSVFFAIATLIYAICCPEIVKKYDKYSDFAAEGKGSDQLVSYAYGISADRTRQSGRHRLSDVQLLRFLRMYTGGNQGLEPDNLGQLTQGTLRAENVSVHRLDAGFWYVRDCADKYSPLARLMVQVLYGVGFVLFVWIMVQNFWFVVSRHLVYG